jgi:hypothetical protein
MLRPGLHFVFYDDGREANGGWEQDAVENVQTSGSHSSLHESQWIRDQFPGDPWIHFCNAYFQVYLFCN